MEKYKTDRNEGFSEKEFECFDYINEHRRNLMIALNLMCQVENCLKTNNTGITFEEQTNLLKNMILEHDLSKFNPIEFYEYRRCFFREKNEGKKELDLAWKHHYMHNSHHPEYHETFNTQVTEMDILEMVLDWSAMSIKFGGSPLKYYRENKEKKLKEKFREGRVTFDFRRLEDLLDQMEWAIERYFKLKDKKDSDYTIFQWM